jgi:EAL domain-containing protein (putative c-di-GMP-specific phosphodiesterase class I)
MDALGELVLRKVCQQLRDWQDDLVPVVSIAVNVSPRQFESGRLTTLVDSLLREYDIDPLLLHIEITESALMQNSSNVVETLRDLRAMGIRISVDDFGTGYSSLSYLKNLPIDCLKIDRSFINDMTRDPRDVALVRGIVNIATSLSIRVVAEGVENQRQAMLLRELRCNYAQGFFFQAPMQADACRELLDAEVGRRGRLCLLPPPTLCLVHATATE